ncbi:MAG: metallophosphoesterase [Verrucomicrobiales bacterium]
MGATYSILVVSDIHYAGPLEKERVGYESKAITHPIQRALVKFWRHFIWLRDPFGHTEMIDRVLTPATEPDLVVANGDYSCDSAFIGVSDPASLQSAQICLTKLRNRFPGRFKATFGDHELGKLSMCGGNGGLRVESFYAAVRDLKLEPFWKMTIGNYLLVGVTSSLIALPLFQPETLEHEWPEWQRLRAAHMEQIRLAFNEAKPGQKILLFCHDPSALPFLHQEPAVQKKFQQLEQTVIGHLHSGLILWKSRTLAGFPVIHRAGKVVYRMSAALNKAKTWKPFRVKLCPSLSGIQIRKAGGYYMLELDPEAKIPLQWNFCRLKWGEQSVQPPV